MSGGVCSARLENALIEKNKTRKKKKTEKKNNSTRRISKLCASLNQPIISLTSTFLGSSICMVRQIPLFYGFYPSIYANQACSFDHGWPYAAKHRDVRERA